jgi:hypothetical protein
MRIFAARGDAMSNAENSKACAPAKRGKPKRPRPSGLRRQASQRLDIPAMIDDFFQTTVVLTQGETSRRVPCFEAILHQLWLKSMAGSAKASKLLTRYINFAGSRGGSGGFEIRVIPDASDE